MTSTTGTVHDQVHSATGVYISTHSCCLQADIAGAYDSSRYPKAPHAAWPSQRVFKGGSCGLLEHHRHPAGRCTTSKSLTASLRIAVGFYHNHTLQHHPGPQRMPNSSPTQPNTPGHKWAGYRPHQLRIIPAPVLFGTCYPPADHPSAHPPYLVTWQCRRTCHHMLQAAQCGRLQRCGKGVRLMGLVRLR